MEKELVKVLKEYEMQVINDELVDALEFVSEVIGAKNPDSYVNTQLKNYDMTTIKKRAYLDLSQCIQVIKQNNKVAIKQLYERLRDSVEPEEPNILDLEEKIFKFDNKVYETYFVKTKKGTRDILFVGVMVAKYLGYKDPDDAIDNIDDEYKFVLQDIRELYPDSISQFRKGERKVYINLSGFYNLVWKSKKPIALKIKKWLETHVLPSLVNRGIYAIGIRIKKFYDAAYFSDFDDKPVIYVGYVGMYEGEPIFKYGMTRDMFSREHKNHKKQFDLFQVVLIEECQNCEKVEEIFGHEMVAKGLHRKLRIKEQTQKELFTTDVVHDYEQILGIFKRINVNNPLPAIAEIVNEKDHEIELAKKEISVRKKREEDERDVELEKYRIDKEIEMQTKIKIAEIESSRALEILKIKIELVKEKSLTEKTKAETYRVRNKGLEMELEIAKIGKK